MSNTNYDTRPTAPPFFGSEHTERSTHTRLMAAISGWFFGTVALAVTGWWTWLIADRWANGVDVSAVTDATVAGVGVVVLVLWAVTLLAVRAWRRA